MANPRLRRSLSTSNLAGLTSAPDSLLLSPPEARAQPESLPSCGEVLRKALESAREAVELDSAQGNHLGAYLAYGQSVALLSEVIGMLREGTNIDSDNKHEKIRRLILIVSIVLLFLGNCS
jgi:hypothetical protein